MKGNQSYKNKKVLNIKHLETKLTLLKRNDKKF